MSEKIDLLVIDPQNDFCDKKGSLYVPGADEDMRRIAEMIDRSGKMFSNIHVTLDSHHIYSIFHTDFWRNSDGKNPDPFTVITNKDIVDGVWFPIFAALPGYPNAREYVKEYTKKLEEGGRYPLILWPNHCIISSWGCGAYPLLYDSLVRWERANHNNVNYVSKGSAITTENYSCIKSEVPDANIPSSQINAPFVHSLGLSDKLLLAGEAGSHCLKFSAEDLVSEFNDKSLIKKICLLTDGTSPVGGFEKEQEDFIKNMSARGMQIALTTDI